MNKMTIAMILCGSIVLNACDSPKSTTTTVPPQEIQTTSPDVKNFNIKSISYNDVDGVYDIELWGRTPPLLTTANVKFLPLTEKEKDDGKEIYAELKGNDAILHIDANTEILVTAATTNQAEQITGDAQSPVIITQQTESVWTPLAEAYLISQIFGSNSTQYVPVAAYPPPYESGGYVGFGGYGPSYDDAKRSYQKNHQVEPPAVKFSKLRTSGNLTATQGLNLRSKNTASIPIQTTVATTQNPKPTPKSTPNPPISTPTTSPKTQAQPSTATTTAKPTGKGVGSSNLKPSTPAQTKPSSPKRSFRTKSSKPSRSFGSGSRRRR